MSCRICGARDQVEWHHLARHAYLSVTVPLCKDCHRRVWWQEQLAGAHQNIASEDARAWAIWHGLSTLLVMSAEQAGIPESEIERAYHDRAAVLKLVNAGSDELIGPRPGRRLAALQRGEPDVGQDRIVSPQATRRVLHAIAQAVSEWLPASPELADIAGRLAQAPNTDPNKQLLDHIRVLREESSSAIERAAIAIVSGRDLDMAEIERLTASGLELLQALTTTSEKEDP
jgi:hypothetical protein